MKYCSEQGEENHGNNSKNADVEIRIQLVKLIVVVVKHVIINELRPVDYQAAIDFCRQQLVRRASSLSKLYEPTHCLCCS
jgi:hypothetical protein